MLRVLLLFLLLLSACGQKQNLPPNSKVVDLDLDYRFSTKGGVRRVDFTLILPSNLPGVQRLLELELSRKPVKRWEQNGNDYALFRWVDLKDTASLKIRAKVATGTFWSKEASGDSLWLRSEPFLETTDSLLLAFGDSVLFDSTAFLNRSDSVRAIFLAVRNALVYKGYSSSDRGAAKALRNGGGDCSEYSDLMVTLLRQKNIPARAAYGYITRYSNTPKHAWVEVYEDSLWKRYDPTFAPLDSNKVYLQNNSYITLSRVRHDELLDWHHYAGFKFWGKDLKFEEKVGVEAQTVLPDSCKVSSH